LRSQVEDTSAPTDSNTNTDSNLDAGSSAVIANEEITADPSSPIISLVALPLGVSEVLVDAEHAENSEIVSVELDMDLTSDALSEKAFVAGGEGGEEEGGNKSCASTYTIPANETPRAVAATMATEDTCVNDDVSDASKDWAGPGDPPAGSNLHTSGSEVFTDMTEDGFSNVTLSMTIDADEDFVIIDATCSPLPPNV
jgi:hypothetical protein